MKQFNAVHTDKPCYYRPAHLLVGTHKNLFFFLQTKKLCMHLSSPTCDLNAINREKISRTYSETMSLSRRRSNEDLYIQIQSYNFARLGQNQSNRWLSSGCTYVLECSTVCDTWQRAPVEGGGEEGAMEYCSWDQDKRIHLLCAKCIWQRVEMKLALSGEDNSMAWTYIRYWASATF